MQLVLEKDRQINSIILEHRMQLKEKKKEVKKAQEVIKVINAKIETFGDIVQTIEREKRKNQVVVQENMKLAVKLKESESKIIGLHKKLRNTP